LAVYCLTRRAAAKLTARRDIDVRNAALYWHFCVLTVVIAAGVTAVFPLVA
jgi:cytochrome c oxidase subunit I+III